MATSQLDALERAMGVVSVSSGLADDDDFDGEIEPDDEAGGREAVVYDADDDPLLAATPGKAVRPPPALDSAHDPALDAANATALDSAPTGPDGLIAQLVAMADQLERESGQPEHGIRAQIATLRSVMAGQPASVAAEVERLAAMTDAEALALAETDTSAVVQRIEEDLARVGATLAADAGTAQMLGSLLRANDEVTAGWMPAAPQYTGGGDEDENGEGGEQPATDSQGSPERAGGADWGPTPVD